MPEFFSDTAPALAIGVDDALSSSMPCTPINLLAGATVVSCAEAALSRLLGRGLQLALPMSAMRWLMLPPAGDSTLATIDDDGDWLLLDTTAGPLYLEYGARFIAGLTGIDGSACDDEWPQWMVGAVAGRLTDSPLESVRGIRRSTAPQDSLLQLPWHLQEQSHAISALAAAAPDTWCGLLADAEVIALRMPWSDWLPLMLDWPVVLATHRLPLAIYDTLRSGDLILPDSTYFDSAGRGRVTLGRRHWQTAFVAPCHLQLLNEENSLHTDLIDEDALESGTGQYRDDQHQDGQDEERASTAPPETDVAAGSAESPESPGSTRAMPGAISLTLRFELGRIRMTLDQLRALGPHSVLEVLDGTPHSIAIACGATEVGRGEVVDVDGRLGVRITHWAGAC